MCSAKDDLFNAQNWAGQLPDSDALWVRLDEHADATAIEDAVIDTVQHMLQPNMDVVNDLQVRALLLSPYTAGLNVMLASAPSLP